MSYAGTSLGFMAKAAEDCHGGLMSKPDGDFCCPVSEWNNGTYGTIKGYPSLRRKNEERIHRALKLLLATCPAGDIRCVEGETAVQRIAYDAAAKIRAKTGKDPVVQPGLVANLWRAANNFNRVFSWSRWQNIDKCVPFPKCQTDGYYSCFRVGASGHQDVVATLSGMVPLTARDRSILTPSSSGFSVILDSGAQAPSNQHGLSKPLWDWLQSARHVIASVPRGRASDVVSSMPTLCGDPPCDDELLKWQGNVLVPSAWLSSFISVFAKRISLSPALMSSLSKLVTLKKPVPKGKLSLVAAKAPALVRIVKAPKPTQDEGSVAAPTEDKIGAEPSSPWVWGVAAIAILGGAAFVVARSTGK